MSSELLERSRALELAAEVDAAVDQLWAAGSAALVLRLLLEDCERLLRAWRCTPESDGNDLVVLDTLCCSAAALGAPGLERELGPAHRELLDQLAAERRRCVARLRGTRTRSKRLRWGVALALTAALACAGYFWLRNAPQARASAVYSSDFPADLVLDGLTKTEWLLPGNQTGWLELAFSRPRSLQAVRVTNSQNGRYRDRATKAFKLEAFAGPQLLASARGRFPPIADDQGPLTLPLAARGVTHVRITVESFYGLGGGLAEVQVR